MCVKSCWWRSVSVRALKLASSSSLSLLRTISHCLSVIPHNLLSDEASTGYARASTLRSRMYHQSAHPLNLDLRLQLHLVVIVLFAFLHSSTTLHTEPAIILTHQFDLLRLHHLAVALTASSTQSSRFLSCSRNSYGPFNSTCMCLSSFCKARYWSRGCMTSISFVIVACWIFPTKVGMFFGGLGGLAMEVAVECLRQSQLESNGNSSTTSTVLSNSPIPIRAACAACSASR